MLQFGVRKFRTGRDLEAAIDDFVDKTEKQAEQIQANPQPQNQAETAKHQADIMRAHAEITKAQIEAQSSQEDNQRAMLLKQLEAATARDQMEMEAQFKREEHGMKMQELAARRLEHAQANGLPPPMSPAIQQHQDNISAIARAAEQIHRAASMGRRIVRGPDNRIIGIEPVPVPAPQIGQPQPMAPAAPMPFAQG
jgi:hypothetical protein